MRSPLAAAALLSLLAPPLRPAPSADPDLATGIRAFEAKDYQAAVSALTRVLGRTAADPARVDDAVAAYLHLGAAYAALGQESPARSQFVQALQRRPETALTVLNPSEAATRLFAEAKADAKVAIEAAQPKKSPKKALALAGVAAVGAGLGVAVAVGSGDGTAPASSIPNPPPTFNQVTSFGVPSLQLLLSVPGSGGTVSAGARPPRLTFRTQAGSSGSTPPGGYPRLQVVVDLVSPERGLCWRATTAPFALAAGATLEFVVDTFPAPPGCPPPFSTLSMEARVFELEPSRLLSVATYSGGYYVVP